LGISGREGNNRRRYFNAGNPDLLKKLPSLFEGLDVAVTRGSIFIETIAKTIYMPPSAAPTD
jgi:hypothetical protein